MSKQYKYEVKKLPKSEVEIQAEFDAELLTNAHKSAIKKYSQTIDLPGFRKGHVPENIVVEKIGTAALLEDAAEIVLNEFFPEILKEEKLDTIGKPRVNITKIALGNPLIVTIQTSVLPDFELPKYKEIAKNEMEKKDEDVSASEKDIESVLLQIRKNKAHYDWHNINKDKEGHDHPDFEKEENLPILNDDFARAAGNFKDLNELKDKIRENVITDKKLRNIEKKRALVMEALLKQTKIDLPEILIESETEKSMAQLKDELDRVGAKFEDYLKETKKTEEQIKNELKDSSANKARIQLIFNKIAQAEKLEPNKEILEHEVKQILAQYPGASEQNARIYVATQLLNQEVLKLLEKSE